MKKIKKLKEELKTLAVEIRKQKAARKAADNGFVYGLDADRWRARHLHIAYCMLRGRLYEEIEKKCHESPNMDHVRSIMRKYQDEETICDNEKKPEQESTSSTSESCDSTTDTRDGERQGSMGKQIVASLNRWLG
jgi:hypothetical protein